MLCSFFFIVVLSSAHCWFNTVLFHTKCFHCFLPVLCFMMAILSVNWRFSGWWSWMLCSFFFDRCFACCALQYALTVGSTLIRFSRKELLYRWSLLWVKSIIWSIFIVFLPVLFFVMAILSVNRRVYVSDGWFLTSVWWFGANQVPHSPKSPAWNQKSPIWNITLWLTGIIAITKQSTDREKKNTCSIGLQIVLQARMEFSVCFISC